MSASSSAPPPSATEGDIQKAMSMAPVLCAAMKLAGLSPTQCFICLDAMLPVLFFLITGSLDEGPFEVARKAHVVNIGHFRRMLDTESGRSMLTAGFAAAVSSSAELKTLLEKHMKPPEGTTIN